MSALLDTIGKDRATIRAALALTSMNPVQKQLILQLIDRHFSFLALLVDRLEQLERRAGNEQS